MIHFPPNFVKEEMWNLTISLPHFSHSVSKRENPSLPSLLLPWDDFPFISRWLPVLLFSPFGSFPWKKEVADSVGKGGRILGYIIILDALICWKTLLMQGPPSNACSLFHASWPLGSNCAQAWWTHLTPCRMHLRKA